jgi:hypothetical protein
VGDHGETGGHPLQNRRPIVTEEVGPFAISVGFDPDTGHPIEVFITKRAKSGTDLEEILYEIGVAASKIMQGE